jgi:hypothetical protein
MHDIKARASIDLTHVHASAFGVDLPTVAPRQSCISAQAPIQPCAVANEQRYFYGVRRQQGFLSRFHLLFVVDGCSRAVVPGTTQQQQSQQHHE